MIETWEADEEDGDELFMEAILKEFKKASENPESGISNILAVGFRRLQGWNEH